MTQPQNTVVPSVRGVLANPKANFTDVLAALDTEPEFIPPKEGVSRVVPKPVTASVGQVASFNRLVELLDGHKTPTTRRKLSRTEIADANELLAALSEVEGLAKKVRESLRTADLNHRDLRAEELGLVDEHTPVDKDGHYLVKDERLDTLFNVHEQVETTQIKVTLPSVSVPASAILAHVDDEHAFDAEGKQVALTRRDYLAATEQVRVTDDRKLLAHVASNPDVLAPLFAATAQRKGGSLSITKATNAG